MSDEIKKKHFLSDDSVFRDEPMLSSPLRTWLEPGNLCQELRKLTLWRKTNLCWK
jgi:hypothetical protein